MAGPKSLFVPGPTNVPEIVRKAIDIPMEDPSRPRSACLHLAAVCGFKEGVSKQTAAKFFYFPLRGTGGWEAAITNTLNPGDQSAVRHGLASSHIFGLICANGWGLRCRWVDCDWGTGVPVDQIW